jgi:chloramphenicol-sensitive protein RarD
VLITFNWFIFIWTVNSGHSATASLGYFINPLLNFVLAYLFLKERLNKSGLVACALALIGVVVITIGTHALPWQALLLAATFALYGFVKKKITLSAYTGLLIETVMIAPFALVWLLVLSPEQFMGHSITQGLLLVGCGAVTAIPLLLFAEATKRISYIALGFIQYISPTITFFLAVFAFHESFTIERLAGFVLIWIGIAVFSAGVLRGGKAEELLPLNEQ